MIHPQHTAIQFVAVMSTIRFPITALGAPLGATIGFANKNIFCVELFESGTIGIRIWCYKVRLALEVVSAMRFVAPILAAPPRNGERAERHQAGVGIDGDDRAQVGRNHEEHEQEIEHEDGDGAAILFSVVD